MYRFRKETKQKKNIKCLCLEKSQTRTLILSKFKKHKNPKKPNSEKHKNLDV